MLSVAFPHCYAAKCRITKCCNTECHSILLGYGHFYNYYSTLATFCHPLASLNFEAITKVVLGKAGHLAQVLYIEGLLFTLVFVISIF